MRTYAPFVIEMDMKAILRLLAVFFVLLATTQCEEAEHQSLPTGTSDIRIYDVEHNGHKYIIFRTISGYGVSMVVEHDPDCPCWFIDLDEI